MIMLIDTAQGPLRRNQVNQITPEPPPQTTPHHLLLNRQVPTPACILQVRHVAQEVQARVRYHHQEPQPRCQPQTHHLRAEPILHWRASTV